MPTFFAVDTMAVLYRSYFAMIRKPLVNSKGINTSGLFGLTNTLLGILQRENPDYLAVVSDLPDPTFRHQRYPEYKATREKMPDDLVAQLPYIPRLVEALGLPYLTLPGYEADDIIGTLVRRAATQGMDCYMVTGDKDFMQLIGEHVWMYSAKGDEMTLTAAEGVMERLGCTPEQVVNLLALMGDASDNVPGVRGVGPKTAAKLIAQFGTLEALYERLAEVKNDKLRNSLQDQKDNAYLSRELVTIDTQVPLSVELSALALHPKPLEGNTALVELFTELEFQTLRDRLLRRNAAAGVNMSATGRGTGVKPAHEALADPGDTKLRDSGKRAAPEQGLLALDEPSTPAGPNASRGAVRYFTLKSLPAIAHQLEIWRKAEILVVDTETTGLDFIEDEIIGLSFSTTPGQAFYIPLNHPHLAGQRAEVLALLQPLLESSTPPKAGHNMKYDLHLLRREGLRVGGVAHDTMIASHLTEPAERHHNLDSVALRTLGITKVPTEALIGTGKHQITMAEVDIATVADYACEDADVTLRLHQTFLPRLKETGQLKVFTEVEMPLVPVLMEMEQAGIRFDQEGAQALSDELQVRLGDLSTQIYALAGESEFNINSIVDLQRILYEKLRLHEELGVRPRKIKTGMGFSTDEETLEKLASHPLPQALLEYRELVKLKNTYLDQLGGYLKPSTGKIHTSFRQANATTGRLASDNPNLQNIPIRTPLGRKVRALFVPSNADHLLMSADYSQIELRVVAHYSEDPTFLEAYRTGSDIHALTAAAIFGVPVEQVDRDMRAVAKEVNFGLIYRMGADRLALVTKRSKDEAKAFIERYFQKYATIRALQDELLERARKEGFALTLLGRRRYLPEINHTNGQLARLAEGGAVNTPIQGTAAEIIKLAMIAVQRRIQAQRLRARMVLTVHDELVFDVPRDEVEVLRTLVTEEMSQAMTLKVPLVVDVGVG
ncbi:MAG: DNA polymerase I, partial [Deltaproteobacteria bacterium]|nr:DNA polymerase I [Deltaproteobacteria bacterium]